MEVNRQHQRLRWNRRALAAACALGLAVLLEGCGGDDNGDARLATSTSAGGPSAVTTATTAAPPTVASPSPSPTARASPGSKYIVKAGDTLWDLAQDWGVTIDAIVSANDLASPDDLTIGQELTVP